MELKVKLYNIEESARIVYFEFRCTPPKKIDVWVFHKVNDNATVRFSN